MFSLNFISELLVGMSYELSLQSLHVGAQARDSHKGVVVHLEDTLEVGVDGHELRGETSVCCDGDTVFACHSDHRVAVVIKDGLQAMRLIECLPLLNLCSVIIKSDSP